MGRTGHRAHRTAGATLIELVVVLTITAILAGGMATFLARPMEAYVNLVQRARLVEMAEGALRRMARDVRRALPNSLRVGGGGTVLEILHVAEGMKYRREAGTGHATPSDWLGFGVGGDDQWNLLGDFRALAFSYGTPLAAGHRIAVHPTGTVVYAEAALGTNPGTITPAGTSVTVLADGDEDQIQLSAPYEFRFESPRQRFYVVDGPVTFRCDTAAGTLTRFSGYAIAQAQPLLDSAPPLSTASDDLLAKRLAGCGFTWQPGAPWRSGVLTVELVLTEGSESIRLLHQIHVENAP